eukprot:14938788-Ditylum_brightwellii.AAC.1
MDAARGQRKISTPSSSSSSFTSSAKALYQCINKRTNDDDERVKQKHEQRQRRHGVYLFPTVDEPIRRWLPSPLDEVAGVFHIK